MIIRRAAESEEASLSQLAWDSKAHWGYAAAMLDAWREQLAVTAARIREHPTFVAELGGIVAGFYSLHPGEGAWELDNLWVLPAFMHRGVGRALLAHALETAAQGGAREVTVDSDPHAEAFYLQCGARRRGAVAAPIAGEPHRMRPQLAFEA